MRSLLTLAAAAASLPFTSFAMPPPEPAAEQAQGKYIVVMHPTHELNSLIGSSRKGSPLFSVTPTRTYNQDSMRGFAASLTASQVKALNNDPRVLYVEKDGILHTQDQKDSAFVKKQVDVPWGLGRISHRAKGMTEYVYDSTAGAGTCAYIIDTGIRTNHTEFGGRATFVHNYDTVDGSDEDMYGHGTHVAGTIGSATYGVSKSVKLYAMKVCNQFGMCDVSAVNQAILDTIKDSSQRDCPNGVVINMSLGAPNDEWQSLRQAVKTAADAGIFVAVAAGNSAVDATGYTPASAPGACAVGASNKDDIVASFSNFGKPVAVFGPGVDVLSTFNDGKTTTMSGTSMASPHIAGLGAYLLGLKGKQDPLALCQKIADMSTPGKLTSLPAGTVNKVAFNGQE